MTLVGASEIDALDSLMEKANQPSNPIDMGKKAIKRRMIMIMTNEARILVFFYLLS